MTMKYLHIFEIHKIALCTKISQRIVHRFSGAYVSEDILGLLARNNKN